MFSSIYNLIKFPKYKSVSGRRLGSNPESGKKVYSPKYTNPNEHPIDHLHSVLCDINFNIVFDPQPEYAKVVNYPYSRLIDYNGIRSIDIIRKL